MCRLQRRVVETSAGYDPTGVFESCGITSANHCRCLVEEHISFEFSGRMANSSFAVLKRHTHTHTGMSSLRIAQAHRISHLRLSLGLPSRGESVVGSLLLRLSQAGRWQVLAVGGRLEGL